MAEITVTGNLAADAELSFTPNGKAKLEFAIGDTPRRLNQQTNQWEDAGDTTWWRVTEWGDKAEALADAGLVKGTKVLVTGTAGVRTYEKKDGSKGFSAEVRPKTIALVPRRGHGGNAPASAATWQNAVGQVPQSVQQPAQGQWGAPQGQQQGWGGPQQGNPGAPF